MKELLQRLSALDEDASAALKVITFFDTLLNQNAGLAAFVRGAAVLSGCPSGFHHPLHRLSLRMDGDGRSLPPVERPEEVVRWPHLELGDGSGGIVWVERPDGPGANDGVLLERLAVCLHLTIERVSPLGLEDDAGAFEMLLSATSTADARRKAARRLGLRETAQLRAVAVPVGTPAPRGYRSAVVTTDVGDVRAMIVHGKGLPPLERAGIGGATPLDGLEGSWQQAVLLLRIASAAAPVLGWEEVGAFGALVAAARNAPAAVPDTASLARLAAEPGALETLDALVHTDSTRAASAVLGLHHSTVQARQNHAQEVLGFAVSTPAGRVRLASALALHRLATVRF